MASARPLVAHSEGLENRQDIFEEAEDYVRMLSCLQQMLEQYDEQGNRLPPLCTFYAYCLMLPGAGCRNAPVVETDRCDVWGD